MLLSEFENLTGIYPSNSDFKVIEDLYMSMTCDKYQFCKMFSENEKELAKKAQFLMNVKDSEIEENHKKEIEELKDEIKNLKERLKKSIKDLEFEEEWKSYFPSTMLRQETYDKYAKEIPVMDISAAKEFIHNSFGFDVNFIEIHSSLNKMEINRHMKIRTLLTEKPYSRAPLYDSTDFNYVFFSVKGLAYECFNGELISIC